MDGYQARRDAAAKAIYQFAGLPTAWELLGDGQQTWKDLADAALTAAAFAEAEKSAAALQARR